MFDAQIGSHSAGKLVPGLASTKGTGANQHKDMAFKEKQRRPNFSKFHVIAPWRIQVKTRISAAFTSPLLRSDFNKPGSVIEGRKLPGIPA